MIQFTGIFARMFKVFMVTAVLVSALATSAIAQTQYTITDLGTLGGIYSTGSGVNNFGQVTGESDTGLYDSNSNPIYHAFLYNPALGGLGVMQDLGDLGSGYSYGYGINNSGQVAGEYGPARAFLYTPGTGMVDLGDLGGNCWGRGINDSGQVTGYTNVVGYPGVVVHAFSYSLATGMQDIGSLNGNSYGYGINNSGQVAGEYGPARAFLYTPGTGMVDLGDLGGGGSWGYGINNLGQVTGESEYLGANTHAFLYTPGTGMQDLLALGSGINSVGNGINNSGQVVGSSETGGGYDNNGNSIQHAFLYSAGQMTDLNNLIDPSLGWTLTGASAINDWGQITGIGTINGEQHAFLLTPPPVTTSLTGTSVAVGPGQQIGLTFNSVSSSGTVSVTAPTSAPAPATNFSLLGAAYDITTTATFSGSVEVCIGYNAAQVASGQTPLLLHYTGTPPAWIALPSSVVNNEVCGLTSSFSPFAVAVATPPPIANAGTNKTVHEGATVTLDGSLSSDPSGKPLTYLWHFVSWPNGTAARLSNPTAMKPSFTTDKLGNYVVQLVVTDSIQLVSTATVTISTSNSPPVASAGPNQIILLVGSTVQLDGSDSYDPNGDSITYQWSFLSRPSGSNAQLSNPTAVNPTFVADVDGTYQIQLMVTDCWGAVSTKPSTVTVSFDNIPPVADAGAGQAAVVGDIVTLNGSGSSDANGIPLTYKWSFVSVPQCSKVTIEDPTSVESTFIPDMPGIYVVQLIVSDSFFSSPPSTVQIKVVSVLDDVLTLLKNLVATVGSLDKNVFKNPSMRNQLISMLYDVMTDVEQRCHGDALQDLQDNILRRVDGCALTGMPDKDDWIIDCTAQRLVYMQLMGIIAEVQELR